MLLSNNFLKGGAFSELYYTSPPVFRQRAASIRDFVSVWVSESVVEIFN